jgi:flagellar hook-associated protein 1 FlgK
MFDQLLIGLSGITAANQSSLVIGQNITKSDIPQYHKKISRLSTSPYGHGIIYSYTHRETDNILQKQFYDKLSKTSYYVELDKYHTLLESYIINGDFVNKFNSIYNILLQITGNKYKINDLISVMNDFAFSIRHVSEALDNIKINIESQVASYVEQINSYLNIFSRQNYLLDNKDEILEYLSSIIDTKPFIMQDGNTSNVLTSNGLPLILDTKVYDLRIQYNNGYIYLDNGIGNVNITYGKLGALLYLYNQYIPKIKNELNSIVSDFIRNINQIQATGLGAAGEYDSAVSHIAVPDVNAPLASQNLPLEIFEGDITISITDTNLSTRNNYTIHINPNIDSLYDISNMLSSIPGVSSSVNPLSGLITINALPGFRFDFAGRDTLPSTNSSVTNSDTAGLLSALGINGIFDGYNADTIKIQQQFIDNPNLFALSKTGEMGNNDNLIRLLNSFKSSIFTHNNFTQNTTNLISNIGNFGFSLKNMKNYSNEEYNATRIKLNEIIGVDTNEEFINLLSFQRALESSSKYISIVNRLFDSLLDMLG